MRQNEILAVIARQRADQAVRKAYEEERKLFEMLDNMGEQGKRIRMRIELSMRPLPPLPGEVPVGS